MSIDHVAIVGGGYSGTVQAIELLRRGLAVTLIERAPRPARGVAYGTSLPDHLLNVRASGMSAFADEPDHFAAWAGGMGLAPADFAPRQDYGRYLGDVLGSGRDAFGNQLRVLHDQVVGIEGPAKLRLASGGAVAADAIVLALGNLPPEHAGGPMGALPAGCYVTDPWAADLARGLEAGDTALLIGTGLTAIDVTLTLDAAGFEGRIVALSRRGLMPRAHAARPVAPPAAPGGLTPRCTSLLRAVRAQAEQVGWRNAVDALRPVTQALWADAEIAERKRFLRHLRPWWDVHRHRIAPQIADRIETMQRDGRLIVAAGKIVQVTPVQNGAAVTWRPRGARASEELTIRRIVNCTGPRTNVLSGGEPLLDGLAAAGRIRPDPCRLGIDVDRDCRVIGADGTPAPELFAIGPLTRGAFWEIVAVPDIRAQVRGLAQRIAARMQQSRNNTIRSSI